MYNYVCYSPHHPSLKVHLSLLLNVVCLTHIMQINLSYHHLVLFLDWMLEPWLLLILSTLLVNMPLQPVVTINSAAIWMLELNSLLSSSSRCCYLMIRKCWKPINIVIIYHITHNKFWNEILFKFFFGQICMFVLIMIFEGYMRLLQLLLLL